MGSPVRAAAEAIDQHISGLTPETPEEAEQMFTDLKDYFDVQARAFHHLADRFGSDLPMDPAVTEYMREIGSNLAALSSMSEELYRTHRAAHEAELRRAEQPRPGEPMWNVT